MLFQKIKRKLEQKIKGQSLQTAEPTTSQVYQVTSFSQEGEDRVLFRYFEGRGGMGFYVDVGAHHPFRFSNTYLFHKLGWRGINIDPLQSAINLFNEHRPEDTNLNLGIGAAESILRFFEFEESAFNTFDEALAKTRPSRIVTTNQIQVQTLARILDQHLPESQRIDFLTIDAEGFDLQVITSNDWHRFRPEIVIIEVLLTSGVEDVMRSDVHLFMHSVGYILYGKCVNSVIYKDANQIS